MRMSLKSWRRSKGYTFDEMADLLGVHVNTYRNWEENPQKISIGNAVKIAEILETDLGSIIFLP